MSSLFKSVMLVKKFCSDVRILFINLNKLLMLSTMHDFYNEKRENYLPHKIKQHSHTINLICTNISIYLFVKLNYKEKNNIIKSFKLNRTT